LAADMTEAIHLLVQERNMSMEMVLKTIEDTIRAAYKQKFGNADNVVVRFNDDQSVSIYAKKQIVDGVYDPVCEIDLEEARALNPEADIGDELLIEVNPKEFDRISVQSARQTARQSLRDLQKDSLYAEFKDKVGEIVIGYFQRERNGTIYLDLGRIEGVLPKKYQSKEREFFNVNDRIKALIMEVNKTKTGLQVVLSRTHTDFVKAIFELEVPEIYDKTVEIHKIVREPGYRTKLAVYSNKEDVDPVGACVGLKGVRILAVIKELYGEKIDVLRYDTNPRDFIMNALSPAEVKDVIILDEAKHQALAVVAESQLSLAIGKQGLNVRLANRLVDWNIDVKTDQQLKKMDLSAESRRKVSELFGESEEEIYEEYSKISELPGLDPQLAAILQEKDMDDIETFLAKSDEELAEIGGISPEQIESLRKLIDEYVEVEVVEEEPPGEPPPEEGPGLDKAEEEAAPEEYVCPECGTKITLDMTNCPNCGVGLSFEYDEE